MQSKQLVTVDVGISNGIPDESKLLPGDLLYFRGKDTSRKATGYVGHVEMYVGNGQISGHGSGTGPTRKNMKEYCQQRQNTAVASPIHNKGLICLRRAVPADVSDYSDWPSKVTELYVTQLGRLPEDGGLAFWAEQLASGGTWESIANGIIESQEGKERFVRELYTYHLNREPDEGGMHNWMAYLNAGGSRVDVLKAFLNSPEYKAKH